MTTATLSFYKVQKTIQSKVESMEMPVANWKALCFIGFFVGLVLLAFYVWQVNDLTKGFYLINNYQRQISKISDENKNLEVSFAENSFLGQAVAKVQALNFQKVTSVKYIQIPTDSVAMAQKK